MASSTAFVSSSEIWAMTGLSSNAVCPGEARVSVQAGDTDYREGNAIERLVQTALDDLVAPEDAPLQARVLADFSRTAHRQTDIALAHELAERALAAADAASDQRALAQAHNMLGVLARTAGQLKTAQDHLEESLSLAEAFDDESARAAALNNLSLVVADGGDYTSAVELAQAALALCRQIDDRHREAAVLNNLADFYHLQGDEDASRHYLEDAVVIFSEIGIQVGENPEIWKLTEW